MWPNCKLLKKSQSVRTQQRLVRVWPLNLPSVSVMLHPVLPTAELFVILIPFGVLLNFPVSGGKWIFTFFCKWNNFIVLKAAQASGEVWTLKKQIPFPTQHWILTSHHLRVFFKAKCVLLENKDIGMSWLVNSRLNKFWIERTYLQYKVFCVMCYYSLLLF